MIKEKRQNFIMEYQDPLITGGYLPSYELKGSTTPTKLQIARFNKDKEFDMEISNNFFSYLNERYLRLSSSWQMNKIMPTLSHFDMFYPTFQHYVKTPEHNTTRVELVDKFSNELNTQEISDFESKQVRVVFNKVLKSISVINYSTVAVEISPDHNLLFEYILKDGSVLHLRFKYLNIDSDTQAYYSIFTDLECVSNGIGNIVDVISDAITSQNELSEEVNPYK